MRVIFSGSFFSVSFLRFFYVYVDMFIETRVYQLCCSHHAQYSIYDLKTEHPYFLIYHSQIHLN